MELEIREIKDYQVIDMPGVVNYEANLALKAKLEALCGAGKPKVAIDLSKVSFIGSLGIGLLSFAKKLVENAEGNFCIVGPNKTVLRIMQKMKLNEIFTIHKDESGLE